jgi:sporulation protein YlmC with PRC-barrel domain
VKAVKMVVGPAQLLQIVFNVRRVISLKCTRMAIIVLNVKKHVHNVLLHKTAKDVLPSNGNGTALKIPAHNVQKINS